MASWPSGSAPPSAPRSPRSSGRNCSCRCPATRSPDPLSSSTYRLRAWLARFAHRRAEAGAARGAPPERWLRVACALAPAFGPPHQALIAARRRAADPLGAVEVARSAAVRFDASSDAWVALGDAALGAYRTRDALVAFERALVIEERPDAALAAGKIYLRLGDAVTAGARFARAYAAGAGPEALRENAQALATAGDAAAAAEAIALWERETGRPWDA